MKRLISLVVSGLALAACASPTEPVADASTRIVSARKALTGATRAPAPVNARISAN